MKNLFVFLMVFVSFLSQTTEKAFAFIPDYPSNSKYIHIFDVKISSTQKIVDVYYQIDSDGKYKPNDWVCRANEMNDGDSIKRNVVWSVWYRPGALVSKDAECTTRSEVIDSWIYGFKKSRPIGSNFFEPHHDLAYFAQFKNLSWAIGSSRKTWCKANSLGLMTWNGSYKNIRHEKAIWLANSNPWIWVSRDVTCTQDLATYFKWKRNPWWKEVVTLK